MENRDERQGIWAVKNSLSFSDIRFQPSLAECLPEHLLAIFILMALNLGITGNLSLVEVLRICLFHHLHAVLDEDSFCGGLAGQAAALQVEGLAAGC